MSSQGVTTRDLQGVNLLSQDEADGDESCLPAKLCLAVGAGWLCPAVGAKVSNYSQANLVLTAEGNMAGKLRCELSWPRTEQCLPHHGNKGVVGLQDYFKSSMESELLETGGVTSLDTLTHCSQPEKKGSEAVVLQADRNLSRA